jgi:thioester reductase-like protein
MIVAGVESGPMGESAEKLIKSRGTERRKRPSRAWGFLAMAYHLLTGATGLLGNYLLRDLARAGCQVAVIARAGRVETARQRVESIMASWEQGLGRVLPRPVVLEGDICEPDLGFDQEEIGWIARNCVRVIHNAASLSFTANEQTGEPERSNIEGTRNMLELCRKAKIREFHHVSTAYVCGLRTGRVLEDELDVGQQPGNAYEKSKIEAEKLVRSATFLDSPTVYRPAIIIGDSRTGYTTTYHGFYTPLKISRILADQVGFKVIDGAPMLAALQLTGQERKNYVPVDWVSKIITYLAGRSDCRGRTYHLTPNSPTTIAETCAAIVQTMREYIASEARGRSAVPNIEELQDVFAEQMSTYQAYWRDDPEFDCTNTRKAAGHLPCPTVDLEMLVRTSRYAVKTNFGWPRPQPLLPDFDVQDYISEILPVGFRNGHDAKRVQLIGVQINGPGGGQ